MLRKIISELKFWEDCKKYGMGLWECPKFLFIVMGGVTIIAMVFTHLLTVNYAEPEFVILSVVGVSAIIFTIGNIVVSSFDKMALANRMKTEFVSIVSHQLRTPLTSIKWSIGFLLSGRAGDLTLEQLEHAKTLKDSNDRMVDLVSDLLNVTRIDQGRIVLQKEDVVLADLVRDMVEREKNFARANNVELVFKNHVNSTKVSVEKKYIEIALENLLSNAIRYSEGKGRVEVTVRKRDGTVKVEVKDKGVGIPKSEQKNVFHKFFRSDNALRHRTEGTGLGLYIAKAFVALHGGKMGFSSLEGEGSTFWFELPING